MFYRFAFRYMNYRCYIGVLELAVYSLLGIRYNSFHPNYCQRLVEKQSNKWRKYRPRNSLISQVGAGSSWQLLFNAEPIRLLDFTRIYWNPFIDGVCRDHAAAWLQTISAPTRPCGRKTWRSPPRSRISLRSCFLLFLPWCPTLSFIAFRCCPCCMLSCSDIADYSSADTACSQHVVQLYHQC